MQAFSRLRQERYKGKLADLLFERHPDKFGEKGLAGAQEFVDANIGTAADYGVESELYVAVLMDFLLVNGPDFALDPALDWAVKILNDQELDGDTNVARLDSQWSAIQALEAERSKDGGE